METLTKINKTLEFINDVQEASLQYQKQKIDFAIEIADEVKKCIHKYQYLLPYHLNVIDELHINENGHSRILCKLLRYKAADGGYPILKSLLEYITSQQYASFEKIKIKQPIITQEKCRIDLWIRDKMGGYALIFENKVYNATDQEAQLSRYIDCTKMCGFMGNQIFVIYLSQQGAEPAEQSWGDYKQQFESRYLNLSFRYDILRWLKNYILPIIPEKDYLLRCAIEQYVDYLEGLFNLRAINNKLNMKVEDIIKEKMGLSDDYPQNLTTLMDKIKELDDVRKYLDTMRTENELKCWQIWYYRIKERYGNQYDIVYRTTSKRPQIGIAIPILNKRIYVIIERDVKIYYGIHADMQGDNIIDEEISKILLPVFIKFGGKPEGTWYRWKYVDANKAYEQLCELIDDVLNILD